MTVDRGDGPAQLVLLTSVARRYYLGGKSKIEIAEEFALSRFQVARLLDKACANGLVHIEIGRPGAIDLDASSRLQDAFGLQHSVVVATAATEAAPLRAQLGAAAAAELVGEIVTPQDVVGLGWARAVSAMAAAVSALPPVPVVQLTGSLSGLGIDDSSVELVRLLAGMSGGPAYLFYVPMVVPDAATAQALRRQPEVARAVARFPDVTKAVVGLGGWLPGASTLYDVATDRERALLREAGVCAETSGVFLSAEGAALDVEFTRRMIGITARELHAVPEVIAIAYGVEKAPAVLAALQGGYVTSLVTHTSLARVLLGDAPPPAAP